VAGGSLVLDFDGTITERDLLGHAAVRFGDPEVIRELGPRLRAGELGLNECIAREFATVTAPLDEVLAWVLAEVAVRPGLRELVAGARGRGRRVVVLSSGFVELIEPVIALAGVGDVELVANSVAARPGGWQVRWRDETVCSECGEPCKRVGLPAESPVAYVGDGISDRCAALAADQVFATRGLADWLREQAGRLRAVRRLLRRARKARALDSRRSGLSSHGSPGRVRGQTPAVALGDGGAAGLQAVGETDGAASAAGEGEGRDMSAAMICGMALLAVPQPYDFALSTERFRAFGRDAANLWHEGGLHRLVGSRECRVEAAPGGVEVEPLDAETRPVVEKLLGLGFDLEAFTAWAASEGDPVIARLVAAMPGFRPPLAPDPFESLVTSISAQQVSLFAAFAIRSRLIERYGTPGVHAHGFPDRERVAAAEPEELVALGFSRRKAEYVVGVARGGLDLDELAALPDNEVKAALTSLRGLGEWTADWFLARHLARPRAWPAGDLGLRKAVGLFYRAGAPVSTEEVRAMAHRFAPFENLSAHYLLTGARVARP
jgi:HAD superfamily phosphoserine phosphatase-like hydrolase